MLPVHAAPQVMAQLGIITHEHQPEVYGLFGQPRYSYGSSFEYYYEPSKGGGGRVPLCTTPGVQLYSGDGVELPGRDGVWRVSLFPPRVQVRY